jgi:S1-C subfamily serine protease
MNHLLSQFSDQLSAAVEQASRFVVSVSGHPRNPASGVLWKPGIVVTVAQALRQQTTLELVVDGGAVRNASLVAADAATGLAVLRLEDDGPELAVATAAENAAAVRPGQLALAVGRSRHSGVNGSMGIVSTVKQGYRTWQGGLIDPMLTLDLTLFPSANGGAIVDAEGRLLAVAAAGHSRYGASAIPVSVVGPVVEALLGRGYVPRAFLGVGLRPVGLPVEMGSLLEPTAETGLILLSVEPGSAAHAAGWLVGDILCELGSTRTADPEDVQLALAGQAIGSTVEATLVRGGQLVQVPVVIGERSR